MVVPSRKRLRRKNAPLSSSSELGTQREGGTEALDTERRKKEANPVTKEKRTMTEAHVFFARMRGGEKVTNALLLFFLLGLWKICT